MGIVSLIYSPQIKAFILTYSLSEIGRKLRIHTRIYSPGTCAQPASRQREGQRAYLVTHGLAAAGTVEGKKINDDTVGIKKLRFVRNF